VKHIHTAIVIHTRSAGILAAKGAGLCALVVMGLALSGCGGIGMQGYQEFVDGQYDKAHASFTADYNNHPNNAIAQLNLGDSFVQRGERAQANTYFHQAANSGKDIRPDGMTERHDANTTIADVACRHLHEDGQSDSNCSVGQQASAE
jgi:tetratricopeptide (TPR) repeat protein